MQFLSMASFTAPSQVTLLYQTLSDGVRPSTTSVTAVVELPSSTNQEAEHVQLILDRFSGIGSIEGFPVVGSPLVYSLTPAGESEYMQQLHASHSSATITTCNVCIVQWYIYISPFVLSTTCT